MLGVGGSTDVVVEVTIEVTPCVVVVGVVTGGLPWSLLAGVGLTCGLSCWCLLGIPSGSLGTPGALI